jgi:hypothetical protein
MESLLIRRNGIEQERWRGAAQRGLSPHERRGATSLLTCGAAWRVSSALMVNGAAQPLCDGNGAARSWTKP